MRWGWLGRLCVGLSFIAGCAAHREPAAAPACTAADVKQPAGPAPASPPAWKGVLLEDLTWLEAEKKLTPDTVVVLPLGAAAKEHGPHLKLKNDFLLAEYFKRRLLENADVVVAPTLNYHYYPPFMEYPGSTTLRLETARDLVIDVVKSIAAHGPKRFYVLNTGLITVRALEPAAEALAKDGILLRFTDLRKRSSEALEKQLIKQPVGSHADEVETSVMLVAAPEAVDMAKAVRDVNPRKEGGRGLTRKPDGNGTYSPSGVWGDPTLATKEKGEALAKALLEQMLGDLESLRSATLPSPSEQAVAAQPAPQPK